MCKTRLRKIPNALSVLRILLSLLLFPAFSRPALFIALYALCGASDVLDGYLARRNGWVSSLGQKLDSAADFVFFASLACLVPLKWGLQPFAAAWPIIATVVAVRLASLAVVAIKFHSLAILHSLANKASGLFVYLAVPFHLIFPALPVVEVVSLVCLLAAVEELLIHLGSSSLDRDRPGLFIRHLG
jgi:CDP-diacylglycerol--glycerol-3-phosphate 3-phosphatidyltransferase